MTPLRTPVRALPRRARDFSAPLITLRRTESACYIRVAAWRGPGAPVLANIREKDEATARARLAELGDMRERRRAVLNALVAETAQSLKDEHRAHVNARRNKANRRQWFKTARRCDPAFRLNTNMRAGVYGALKGKKAGRHWQTLVGYSLADLRAHLEARFTDGMTWANYGEWHVDHIRPLASFHFDGTADCPAFKAAWALSNLQPLWKADNLKKGAKW